MQVLSTICAHGIQRPAYGAYDGHWRSDDMRPRDPRNIFPMLEVGRVNGLHSGMAA
jgi:hypothetical protein